MIARTLSFTSCGRLSFHLKQLVWDGENDVHYTFPIEDIGFVFIDSNRIEVTSKTLQMLSESNVAVIICDEAHMPSAQILPLSSHSTSQEIVEAQLNTTEAVNGRIWKKIIRQKIINQASLLEGYDQDASKKLIAFADRVKNYDPENLEAQAARVYFRVLAPDNEFTRNRYGSWPNQILNYGYMVLRAAVARACVGSGLLCIKGIHHHNRYNSFCLADDVMEPYRPFVDQYVFDRIMAEFPDQQEMTKEMRAVLLEFLTCDVKINDKRSPLMVALSYTTASLARYYQEQTTELFLPSFII